jgi:protoporphyrinogen oxidase
MLSDQGWSVMVLEASTAAGGNQKSRSIGRYTFDIGSFIFFDDGSFFKMFPGAAQVLERASMPAMRITPNGRIHAYPISIKDDILRQSPFQLILDILSLLYSRIAYRRQVSAGSFARYHLGARLFERTGLAYYIVRMFGIDADAMDYHFAEKRMNWIARSTSLAALKRRVFSRRSRGAPARSMVRPRAGFSLLYDRVLDQLRAEGVGIRLNAPIERLITGSKSVEVVLAGESIRADHVISTVPLNVTAKLCGLAPSTALKSVTLLTLYVSFIGNLGFSSGILCNFSDSGTWKRLSVHSRAYGLVDGHEYISVEVPITSNSSDAQSEFNGFMSHVRGLGLFAGEAGLVGHDKTPGAYPVYALGASQEARILIDKIERLGVCLIGRQGRFDYLPTTTAATNEARRLAKAI